MKYKRLYSVIFGLFLLVFTLNSTHASSDIDIQQIINSNSQLSSYIDGAYTIAPITIPSLTLGDNLNLWFRVYDSNAKVVYTDNDIINCSAFLFTPNADNIYNLVGNENIQNISITGRRAIFPSSFINKTGNYIWFVGCEGAVKGGANYGFVNVKEKEVVDDRQLSFNLEKTENIVLLVLFIVISLVLLYYKKFLVVGAGWFFLSIILMVSGANFILSIIILISSISFILANKG